ncbi:hypothetical protein G4O51_05935 [Candidatus Bathyarchaeota archaeon A05DMB-2]|nr:hypothetical protein [Candidatus Bathyarchaeota archaeon A05DMB-2]
MHNVTVYAKDEFGNIGASETVLFSITQEPQAFPAALVAASVIIVAVAAVASRSTSRETSI